MTAYLVKRLIQSVFLFWVVTLVTFVLIHQAPGGPAVLANPSLGKDQVQQLGGTLGLDEPIYSQYGQWLGNTALGDLGRSFNQGVPVADLISQRLPNTLLLGAAALVIALVVGIGLGILTAVRRNTWVDYLGSSVGLFNLSVPTFWLGIMLILIFAVQLRWLPVNGMHDTGESGLVDLLHHLVLPAIVASTFLMANVMRYTRASMLEVLDQLYVTGARAKGLRERRVLLVHALKNALVPVVTVIGLSLPQLFGGAAITETVFAWPGIGSLGIEAAQNGDYPLIMGITLVVSAIVIVANLLTDLSYSMIDPRVRLT